MAGYILLFDPKIILLAFMKGLAKKSYLERSMKLITAAKITIAVYWEKAGLPFISDWLLIFGSFFPEYCSGNLTLTVLCIQ